MAAAKMWAPKNMSVKLVAVAAAVFAALVGITPGPADATECASFVEVRLH